MSHFEILSRHREVEPATRLELIDSTVLELAREMEAYQKHPLVRRLIYSRAHDKGIALETVLGDDWFMNEAIFMEAARLTLDAREGQERETIEVTEWSDESSEALKLFLDREHMLGEAEALRRDVEFAFVPLGGGEATPIRVAALYERIKNGELGPAAVVTLGGGRALDPPEIALTGLAGYSQNGEAAEVEADLGRNMLAAQFGVRDEQWQTWAGQDLYVDSRLPRGWRVEYAESEDKHLFALMAPMLEEGSDLYYDNGHPRSRANTWDTLKMLLPMLRGYDDEVIRVAVVTEPLYKFQAPAARAVLAAAGCKVEMVYCASDRLGLMSNDMQAQEVLSLLQSTLKARDFLQASESMAWPPHKIAARGLGVLASRNVGKRLAVA